MKTTPKPLPTTCTSIVDGVRIHGEIVSWDVPPKTRLPHATIVAALAAANLDTGVSRPMAARNAFARACRNLQDRRIIRKVNEDGAAMRFQFTAESHEDGRLKYDCETILTLDKGTGLVASEVAGHDDLVGRAQAAVDQELATRTGNDITDIVQRLFTRHADLFPVRQAGGCYFVPVAYVDFLRQIDTFLASVGANLRRFPVPAGSVHGDRSVSESVNEGLRHTVQEHVAAIEKFDVNDTKDNTLERMVGRINETRFKMEAYAEYLGDKKAEIEAALTEARAVLRAKIAEMGRTVAVAEPAAPIAPKTAYAEVVRRQEEFEQLKAASA